MGNCLVTKLKEVVNNNELITFGKIRTQFKDISDNLTFIGANVESNEDALLTIVGDAIWEKGQKHITYINDKQIKIEANYKYDYGQSILTNANSADFYIDIDKYSLTKIIVANNNIKINLEQFAFMPSLKKLSGYPHSSITGNIKHLSNNTSLKVVNMASTSANESIYGDINVFSNMPSLTEVSLIRNSALTGDISSFKNCRDISILNLNYINNITGDINSLSNLTKLSDIKIANSQIGGNLNTFLDSLYQNGKRGILSIDSRNNDVEYEGSVDIKTTGLSVVFDENGWSESV